MITVRVRHWQSLSWNWLLCPCSLHSLNQHLFFQQLQPWHHGPYRSLPTWHILWFYDHLCPIHRLLVLRCPYSGWITLTFSGCTPWLSSLGMDALMYLQYPSLWKKLFSTNYSRKKTKTKPPKDCVELSQISFHWSVLWFVTPPPLEKAIS